MASDHNTVALDQYARGWGMGDSSIIYPVLDMSYTFTMTGMVEPVKQDNFKQFFVQFRKEVEAGGGPGVESAVFMKFTNVIRRQVTDSGGNITVASATLSLFGTPLYNTFLFRLVQHLLKQQHLKFLGLLLAVIWWQLVGVR